jgi:hypothetical protein
MEVFPGDDFTVNQIVAMIDELKLQGLIGEFEVPNDPPQVFSGHRFWFITGWHHQRIDRPNPKYPDPSEFVDRSTIVRRAFVLEGNGRESKGREGILGKNSERSKRDRFVEPTLEEVSAYCRERSNQVDPDQFIDHYTSNGWLVGKNKMKDWKAAVRTWEKNNHNGNGRKPREETAEEKEIYEQFKKLGWIDESI